ncbi:hypothetical protein N7451_007223 [Penicillium sp. IBT 35674x]|nr:hypothetical protein N7451_007223 [Penicillium sp. IBT 35674x]
MFTLTLQKGNAWINCDCERRVHKYTDWKRHRPVLQSESSPLEEGYCANLLREEELDPGFL